jgi:hypothetical protein
MKNAKLTDVNHVGLSRFHAYTGLESALSELPKLENGATYGWQFYAQDTGNLYLFNESTNGYDLVKSGASADVGEGVLTLKQGNETLGTFSANADDDATITLNTTSTLISGSNALPTSDAVQTAINEAIVTRLTTRICSDGEYDPDTLIPTIEGDEKTLYLTPDTTSTEEVNAYIEWLYIGAKFERIGSTAITIEPVDNATIDAIAEDESKTGEQVLQTTGLTYLWTKLKAKFATLASPAFTGTPTAPTATAGTSDTQIATTAFVTDAINTAITEVENGSY